MNRFLLDVSSPRLRFARNIMRNAMYVARLNGKTTEDMYYQAKFYLLAAERQYRMRKHYKAAHLVRQLINHVLDVKSFTLVLKALSLELRLRERHNRQETTTANSDTEPIADLFSISGIVV